MINESHVDSLTLKISLEEVELDGWSSESRGELDSERNDRESSFFYIIVEDSFLTISNNSVAPPNEGRGVV